MSLWCPYECWSYLCVVCKSHLIKKNSPKWNSGVPRQQEVVFCHMTACCCGVHQTPGEGAERDSCSDCVPSLDPWLGYNSEWKNSEHERCKKHIEVKDSR